MIISQALMASRNSAVHSKRFFGDAGNVLSQYGDNSFSTGMPLWYWWGPYASPFDTGLSRKQNYALYGGVGLAVLGVDNVARHLRRDKDTLTPEERRKNLAGGSILAGLGVGAVAVGGEILNSSSRALMNNKLGRGILGAVAGVTGVLVGTGATLYGSRALVDGVVGKRPKPIQRTYTYT